MTDQTPKITALTPAQAAKILAAAGSRRITEAMVRFGRQGSQRKHNVPRTEGVLVFRMLGECGK